jgi:hypothetical protein
VLFAPDAAITFHEVVEFCSAHAREAVKQGRHANLRAELVEEVDYLIVLARSNDVIFGSCGAVGTSALA